MDLARQGDLAGVRSELSLLSQDGGMLDRALVERVARATVVHDLGAAEPKDAVRLVDLLSPCGNSFSKELGERAAADDDAAAGATRVLLENGELTPSAVIARAGRRSGDAWRAALARALVRPGWGKRRRAFIGDVDERVRRGALHAAAIAKDPDDLSALVEASRLDPDGQSRRLALVAIGALGGARVALTLRDHWAAADSDTRLAIVDAWAAPRVYSAGGLRELVWAAETHASREGIAAAATLAKVQASDARATKETMSQSSSVDPRELGRVLIARFIAEGSALERTYAMERADPTEPLAREALEKAAGDEDEDEALRVAALARLMQIGALREKSLEPLRALGKQKDDVGRAARAALVKAGDSSVATLLQAELSDKKEEIRATAAEQLVELGQESVAAAALADESAEVRVRTACAMVSSKK